MRSPGIFACWLCMALLAGGVSRSADESPAGFGRWEPAIAAFEAADRAAAPVPGGTVFYGSSSIRLWDVKKSFPKLQAVNRGFGGSDMAAAAHFYERVVPRHRPHVVVLYEGDNDLAGGRTPCQILADFETLVAKHREALPEARLICLSVKHSPSRATLRLEQEATNALLRARCALDERLFFVDLAGTLLDERGKPQPKYFVPDMLHLNEDGYARWTATLAPVIERALQAP